MSPGATEALTVSAPLGNGVQSRVGTSLHKWGARIVLADCLRRLFRSQIRLRRHAAERVPLAAVAYIGKRCAIASLLLMVALDASYAALQITPLAPSAGALLAGHSEWTLMLSGEIALGDTERLRKLVLGRRIESAIIYFDSPGGNLLEGLEIGRFIRKRGFSTSIGSRRADAPNIVPGICLSACAYAYLGGVFRFHPDGAKYGVHRFSSQVKTNSDLEIGQIVSAAIVTYLRDMGVDTAVFDRSTSVGPDTVRLLSRQDLETIGVVNNGKWAAQWTIEAIEGGYYLRGVQHRWTGPSKVTFGCFSRDRSIIFMPFYGPVINAKEIESVVSSQAIKLDDALIPLPNASKLLIMNDTLQSIINLDVGILDRLASARTIGWVMNHQNGMFFFSAEIDVDTASRAKLISFFAACLK
jgi:hypothetical protein